MFNEISRLEKLGKTLFSIKSKTFTDIITNTFAVKLIIRHTKAELSTTSGHNTHLEKLPMQNL